MCRPHEKVGVCSYLEILFECVGYGVSVGHFRNLECVPLGMCEYVGCGLCGPHQKVCVLTKNL